MTYWTYAQIKAKVQRDLDLEDESFVSPAELLDYCNEGIDQAEAAIHALYEDYFLTSANISLVNGTAEYSLPSGIYANKIRGLVYNDGVTVYDVKRVKDMSKFARIAEMSNSSNAANLYSYYTKNDSAALGVKLVLLPASRETGSNRIKIWYIRNANRLTLDADTCDIPEFVSFVVQFMKLRCREKEGVATELDYGDLERERKRMTDTLASMVPDGDNSVENDVSHYEEHC